MYVVLCAALCLGLVQGASFEKRQVSDGAVEPEYFTGAVGVTWQTASEFCSTNGGQLVTIDNDDKQTSIENFIVENIYTDDLDQYQYWIGLTDTNGEHSWLWSNGEELGTYSNWAETEPNNLAEGEGEDCVHLRPALGYKWNDLDCTRIDFAELSTIALCETLEDPCSPNPCDNDGTCSEGVCTCSAGFTGDNCEEDDRFAVCPLRNTKAFHGEGQMIGDYSTEESWQACSARCVAEPGCMYWVWYEESAYITFATRCKITTGFASIKSRSSLKAMTGRSDCTKDTSTE